MTLELYIKGKKVDWCNVHIDTTKHVTLYQRQARVMEFVNLLKQRNRFELMITSDWHVMLDITSKMNKK